MGRISPKRLFLLITPDDFAAYDAPALAPFPPPPEAAPPPDLALLSLDEPETRAAEGAVRS